MDPPNEWRLAEVLSPSQLTQFLHCPAKWYFRYFLDLEEPATAATALGRAFHETIAHNFRQKIQTNLDLAVGECLEHFRASLGRHLETASLQNGLQAVELMDLGTVMLEKYLCEAAPLIRPAAVETRVAGLIGGVKCVATSILWIQTGESSTRRLRLSPSRESLTTTAFN